MATSSGRGLREGSAHKRNAILVAARELFLADGFERTSMDAIAARAAVSKRTVYDYYGDKRALLLTVVAESAGVLASVVQQAVDETLGAGKVPGTVEGLEGALVSFAGRIAASALGSPDYAALTRLVSMESANLPELGACFTGPEPEDLLAVRLADFGRRGLLDVPNPRLAADHFVALTLSSSVDSLSRAVSPAAVDTQQVIVEGVRAFLRAYGIRG